RRPGRRGHGGEAPPHPRDGGGVAARARALGRERAGVDVALAIAVVGSLGLDTIETPAGRVEDVLGGSAAYFSLAARRFVPVSLVAVVGTDFPEEARRALEQPDLDLSGLEVQEGRTFRWEGVYSRDMNTRETRRTELNVFERFRPKLHDGIRSFRNVFLANIDPVLQREVLDQLTDPKLVLCDTMNYWSRSKRDGVLHGGGLRRRGTAARQARGNPS